MSRTDVAEYLLMILGWEGIQGDTVVMVDTVERWRDTPGLSFADAYLAALAAARQCVVYTKNVRELRRQATTVPDPLPDGS